MRSLVMVLVSLVALSAHAGDCRVVVRARSQAVFVTVPFAVPVAVPVALVQQPAVIYGYTPQVATPAAQVQPLAQTPQSAAAILARNCASCHTGAAPSGEFMLFAADNTLLEKLPRHLVLESVVPDAQGLQRMPPAGHAKLAEAELRVLRDWARLPKDFVY